MDFEIPESARLTLEARAQKEGGRVIEWNGTTAYWDPDDLARADLFRQQQKRGEITAAELKNQLDVIHEVKLLGGQLVPEQSAPVPEPAAEPEQLPLTDPPAAHAATNAAVKRVWDAADPSWIEQAALAVRRVCEAKQTFTTDDIWETGLPQPREPRALGPVMRRAEKAGLCAQTGRQVATQIPQGHRHPHAEWRSLIYEADLP